MAVASGEPRSSHHTRPRAGGNAMRTTSADNHVAPRPWRMRFASAAFVCCCFMLLPFAVQAQDASADPAMGPSTSSPVVADPPAAGIQANEPKQPAKLADDVARDHSFTTDREERLSFSILLFGFFVLVVQYLLLRRPPRQSAHDILQLLSINLIVTGTLFLISAGFSAQQIAPGLGLFGTIAGYVLGRRMGESANAKTPAQAGDAP
ncbi:MAG: hypothetical protein QM719_12820 [Thermomonas sp.]